MKILFAKRDKSMCCMRATKKFFRVTQDNILSSRGSKPDNFGL